MKVKELITRLLDEPMDAEVCLQDPTVHIASDKTEIKGYISHQPSIDIVRCRECRHRNERCGMGEHRWCEILNMSTTPDDFCSYGERKSE